MLRIAAPLIMFCLFPLTSWAGATFNLDGSYLYSTINDQSSSSFSMVGNNGYSGRGELALGGARWDFVTTGEIMSAKFMAPASKTVDGNKIQSSNYGAGVRWKSSVAWISLNYNLRDSLYLENVSTNVYNLKKAATPFASLDIHFFGKGKGYEIGVDVEGFTPTGTVSTSAGDLKYQYAGRGSVHIGFGNKVRFGIQSGIETHQYSVSTDKYFRTEFFGGLTFGFTFSGGRSSSGSSSGTTNDNYQIPGWPIN